MLHFDQITAQKWQFFFIKGQVFFLKTSQNSPQKIAVKRQVPTYILKGIIRPISDFISF